PRAPSRWRTRSPGLHAERSASRRHEPPDRTLTSVGTAWHYATGCMTENGHISTIADIARLAGVSKSTVSRALNDSPLIGVETQDRIRSLAREHRFRMNVPARRLSLKQSNAVALVSYAYSADSGIPDAFMLEIMSGISAALHANDYDLLMI